MAADGIERVLPLAELRRLCLWMGLAQVPVLLAQFHPVLPQLAQVGGGWVGAAYAGLALLSTCLFIALAGAVVIALVGVLWHRTGTLAVAGAVFWAVAHLALYGDLLLQTTYGYHINAMLIDLATSPAAGDSVDPSPATRTAILLGMAGWAVTGAATALAALFLARRQALPGGFAGRSPLGRWLLGIALTLIVVDKVWYNLGHAAADPAVLRSARILGPLHPVLAPRLDDPLHRPPSGRLALPALGAPTLPAERLPDIVLVVIEGGRGDAVTPQTMPRTCRIGQDGLTTTDHASGGTVTRQGMFSLLYGLWGTGWDLALAGRVRPPLLEALERAGYGFCIASCTDLRWPEFRDTAFAGLGPAIHDQWDDRALGGRVGRDAAAAGVVVEALRRPDRPPLFALLFLDATHFPYLAPPEHQVFQPVLPVDGIDVIDLVRRPRPEAIAALHNRYRNALHYADAQVGRVEDALREAGRLRDAILFVVGDHGEEFQDFGHGPGHLIHHGAYDDAQTRAFCVARLPGVAGRVVGRPSSHCDVVPTIAACLGIAGEPAAFCQGFPLTGETAPPVRVIAAWGSWAVDDGEVLLAFGIGRQQIEAYDRVIWRRHDDPRPALARRRALLDSVLLGRSRFTVP